MIDPGDLPLEFESRRHQTHRSKAALKLLTRLGVDCIFHLGDLIQEYPETPDFPRALEEALQQIDEIGLDLHHCAGNHDVGDKPDPSMPTHPVTAKGLEKYHDRVGNSWYSFDRGDHHFIVLNSQILNTDLEAATEQLTWLRTDLEAASDRRIALFLHLPPYLLDPTDAAFGNYDVIEEPARARLLDLVHRYEIELVCSAHVHFAFFDRQKKTDSYILPSPAFTRPGFSHLFTSPPPPEHGRDDMPKLGFYLFRSGSGFLDQHTIRTSGQLEFAPGRRVITRTARSLPKARLGMTLTHTPTPLGQVPLTYPSIVRQTVHNDYPLLTCQEMGLRHLRVPIDDILNDDQNTRLQIVRERGTALTAILAARPPVKWGDIYPRVAHHVDAIELQVGRTDLPAIAGAPDSSIPISLASVDPSERVTGKQHLRTRVGFRVADASYNHPFERTVVSIAAWEDPDEIRQLIDCPSEKPIDVSLDLRDDDQSNTERVARASLLVACLPRARLFCQPYLDLDRTMDVARGFLDPLCNPRPVVSVYRLLNTILFSGGETWSLTHETPLTIRSEQRELILGCRPTSYPQAHRYDLISGNRLEFSDEVDVALGLWDISV